MTDPTLVLRGSQSGQIVRGTPTNKLTFDATGERVGGVASAAAGLTSFNGRTAPAVVPQAGDYNSHEVSDSSTVGGPSVEDSLDTLNGEVATLSAAVTTLTGEICAKSGTTATGAFACAENLNTTASGPSAHAEGNGTLASGNASHAEGNSTFATGLNSHAEGVGTHANNDNTHAEGFNSTASGTAAHCEGRGGTASGNASHAEGFGCTATGTGAHGEGFQCTAGADTTHAEGQNSQALGTTSHAEGYFSIASGNASHAGGGFARAWLNCDYAHSGGGFNTAGDAQYRAGEPVGSTNGSVPGQSTVLAQGILGEPISLQNSTCYGVTVRATASVQGLGAAARQAAYYHIEFLVAVDSTGAVTVSAVTTVVPPILMGAGFVGATLVPTGVNRVGATPAQLALTFTIAVGLTVQANIVAHIEYVELLGT